MAHFAKIENGIVTNVIVVDNQFEEQGQVWINEVLGLEGQWIQTSYNNRIRKQYAGIGYSYDTENDVFITPQPFPSWELDASFDWQPPTPYPSEEGMWDWNEEQLIWVRI